jgi:leader peptidase (prepilin peptidase)/N-methyltransferase
MGLGSVKAAAMVGAFCGFPGTVVAAFGSFLMGGIVGLYLTIVRGMDRKDYLPFTPHQMISGFIALLWGATISQWYNGWLLSR